MSKTSKTPSRSKRPPPHVSVVAPSQPAKDPVEVFCRVRPLNDDEGESCHEIISDSVIQIAPPENSLAYKAGHRNATQHTFKHVFNEAAGQREVYDRVALPLVEGLLGGSNGLLFTYGITNSGKTYTMSGEPDNAGVLPRCLDMVFNSIANVQAPRCVFKPNKMNGFDVQTEGEARVEAAKHKPKKLSAKARAEMPEYGDVLRVPEVRKANTTIDEDRNYAVFVSYVEFYNNYIYDLLDDSPHDIKSRVPPSKNLKGNTQNVMFVHDVTEVEVKSTDEAYEVLWRGQRKRTVAHTSLNAESSRSHSVFNIRLVSAPLDAHGEEAVQDKRQLCVSQLSLVDLAGSERASRTSNNGERLREANHINTALMVLRKCMETLRDNQLNAAGKIVPYRDSKLTHLFKNYFDGDGMVKMVVCICPKSEDYDETIHVMRFAEVTQEVQTERQTVATPAVGLTPGRRRANLLYKAALHKGGSAERAEGNSDQPVVHPYHLALPLLCVDRFLGPDAVSLADFRSLLEKRDHTRRQLLEENAAKEAQIREMVVALGQENDGLKAHLASLESQVRKSDQAFKQNQHLASVVHTKDEEIRRLSAEVQHLRVEAAKRETEKASLQAKVQKLMKQNEDLEQAFSVYQSNKEVLLKEVEERGQRLEREQQEKEDIKKTMKGFVHMEKEKFERLARQKEAQDQKLLKVMEMVAAPSPGSVARTPLGEKQATRDNLPLSGKQRKRSISENYLEHRPPSTLGGDTIYQPNLKKKKTVTTPKPKHFKDKHSKYLLTHQEQDVKGRTKTRLYKGDILETRGGGHQVRFTGVESLRDGNMSTTSQESNESRPRRSTRLAGKRGSGSSTHSLESSRASAVSDPGEQTDTETRCAVGIEGKAGAIPAYQHISKASAV